MTMDDVTAKVLAETWDIVVESGEVQTTDAEEIARARLVSCAPEMARLLLEAESWPDCRFCSSYEGGIHKSDCRWLALMKKAGLR